MSLQESFITSRRCVMKIDNKLFVTFNTRHPFPSQIMKPDCMPRLRSMHLPMYDSTSIPYMCAVPVTSPYEGALLGRLSQTIEHFPVVKDDTGFKLDPLLAARWLQLEKTLSNVTMTLLQRSPEAVVPLDYNFPPHPHQLGYLLSYPTRNEALGAIQKSRDAFQPLIAHATWAAILQRSSMFAYLYSHGLRSFSNEMLDSGWSSLLRNASNAHVGWITTLLQSAVCDFTIQRAGVVIRKPVDWPYLPKLATLVLSNIPIWVLWGETPSGKIPATWPKDFAQLCGPSPSEIANAPVFFNKTPPPVFAQFQQTNKSHNDSTHIQRIPSATGDTLKPLDIHQWIQMKKVEIQTAFEYADEMKRTKWKQRLLASNIQSCPGVDGAMLYEWDKDKNGQVTRTRVTQGNADQVWTMFGPSQRWFNCVRNEWELCHDLDPTYESLPSESDSDSYLASDDHQLDAPLQGWVTREDAVADKSCETHLDSTFEPEDIATLQKPNADSVTVDAMELLRLRLGFSYAPGTAFVSIGKSPITLEKAVRVIGDAFAESFYSITNGFQESFIQFVMYLNAVGHPDDTLAHIPSALSDLYDDNFSFLAHRVSSVSVCQTKYNNAPLYVIRHRTDIDQPWLIAVTDPCAALHCIRSQPTSLTDIARDFLNNRTPFYTFKSTDNDTPPEDSLLRQKELRVVSNRIGLGTRPDGHILDLTDYVAYEGVKARLVQDKRIARALVKRGGILSRLASGLVDKNDILDGPSIVSGGKYIRISLDMDGRSCEFYDDDLSHEEVAIFVGLYSFQDTVHGVPSEQSWWPTLNKFEESGLNMGVWTPRCEQWFQARRTHILEKNIKALTASKWRYTLRFEMETKRVYKGARILASRFLERYYGQAVARH